MMSYIVTDRHLAAAAPTAAPPGDNRSVRLVQKQAAAWAFGLLLHFPRRHTVHDCSALLRCDVVLDTTTLSTTCVTLSPQHSGSVIST